MQVLAYEQVQGLTCNITIKSSRPNGNCIQVIQLKSPNESIHHQTNLMGHGLMLQPGISKESVKYYYFVEICSRPTWSAWQSWRSWNSWNSGEYQLVSCYCKEGDSGIRSIVNFSISSIILVVLLLILFSSIILVVYYISSLVNISFSNIILVILLILVLVILYQLYC